MSKQRYAVERAARGNAVLVDRWDGMVPARAVAVFQEDPRRPGRAFELALACCTALNRDDESWHPSMEPSKPVAPHPPKPKPRPKPAPAPAEETKAEAKQKPWTTTKELPPEWDQMRGFERAAFMAGKQQKREQGKLV